ncbi:GGDEF domain-containing protein [Thiomicrorhabdus arctica]|uniref:GGDEF domain-containing protein n=1 Tax=Thiomicrorhabdus arctica TaxID=131540 RepID=UPI00037AFE08|nr:GGDEF domain-containing protein [Thiomicrorhabdus arctica]
MLVDGQNDVAIELMQKVVFPLSGAFQKQVTWYADAQEAIFKHKLNQEDKLLSDLVFNVATISVVVILVSIGVAVFVGRRIQILANELESSNQDLEGRVNVRTAALKLTQEKLLEKNKYLKQVSREDGLTGVFNRLGISEVLTSQLLRLQHTQEVFSVVFIDIDFFKIINDEHGHAVGDSVLKSVATKINEVVPEGCAVGRWGGEEFLVICPDGLESVLQVAENIRQAIASMEYEGQNKVTVSLGLTQAHEKDLMDGLLKRADDALYQAKREGRNRVIVA